MILKQNMYLFLDPLIQVNFWTKMPKIDHSAERLEPGVYLEEAFDFDDSSISDFEFTEKTSRK